MSARPMPTQETEPSAAKRFIAAARQLHVDEPDVDKRWQKMGPLLSEMLADPSVQSQSEKWPSCDQGGLAEGGQRAQNLLLYEDPDHGFVINGLVKAPGTRTSIHDHAHNWTLYGVLDGHETVERYERLDDGSKPDHAEVRKSENVQVGPGKIDLVGRGRSTRRRVARSAPSPSLSVPKSPAVSPGQIRPGNLQVLAGVRAYPDTLRLRIART